MILFPVFPRVLHAEEQKNRFSGTKHTNTLKWRTTESSSIYFATIPIPYRFVPEGGVHHVPTCPSLNFVSPTHA